MLSDRFQDVAEAFRATHYFRGRKTIAEEEALEQALDMLREVRERSGIAYVIGNGGSAGIASHFSTDLLKSLKIPSSTLFDSNVMTCLSNDYGYEHVFSYPLEQLLKPHDLLIAISSSGKSPNILRGCGVAIQKETPLITLSGFGKENPLKILGDLNFWTDREDYGLVEMTHFILLHSIVDIWNKRAKERVHAAISGSAPRK